MTSSIVGSFRGGSIAVAAPGPSLALVSVSDIARHDAAIAVSWAIACRDVSWTHWLCADGDVVADCDADTPESVVRALASRALRYRASTSRPSDIIWETDPVDERGILLPGMVCERWWREGVFEGQRLKRGLRTGPARLLCPGSSLVAGVHLACLLLGGEGTVTLYGADGRIVGGERRFVGGKSIHARQNLSERQLSEANRCLERSREALTAGLPGLLMVNATPGSAIGWPPASGQGGTMRPHSDR